MANEITLRNTSGERVKDMVGVRIGMLMVMSRAPNSSTKARWFCVCDCGNTRTMDGDVLRASQRARSVSSCGCYLSKNPPESRRECIACKMVFPLTIEFFGADAGCRGGFLLRHRPCHRAWKKAYKAERERFRPAKAVREGEMCDAFDGCYGLAHRVQGAKCRHCGLPYAEEPAPELQLRRHFERAI